MHKIVGLEPQTMRYIPASDSANEANDFQPNLSKLNISQHLIDSLPVELKQQIQRLDDKVSLYQQWQKQYQQEGRWRVNKVSDSEASFVMDKLLNTHLIEVLQNQHNLTQWQQKRQQLDINLTSKDTHNSANDSLSIPTSQTKPQEQSNNEQPIHDQQYNQDINQTLLQEILNDIEARLDGLLLSYEQQNLEELQAMHRYLKQR